LSTEGTLSLSDSYLTNIGSSHFQDADLWSTLLTSRLPYRRRHCQNYNENGHKEGLCRESSTSRLTSQNPNNKRALM
ncbi:unnamed protein product, partial [Hymenolepis diminuta]